MLFVDGLADVLLIAEVPRAVVRSVELPESVLETTVAADAWLEDSTVAVLALVDVVCTVHSDAGDKDVFVSVRLQLADAVCAVPFADAVVLEPFCVAREHAEDCASIWPSAHLTCAALTFPIGFREDARSELAAAVVLCVDSVHARPRLVVVVHVESCAEDARGLVAACCSTQLLCSFLPAVLLEQREQQPQPQLQPQQPQLLLPLVHQAHGPSITLTETTMTMMMTARMHASLLLEMLQPTATMAVPPSTPLMHIRGISSSL